MGDMFLLLKKKKKKLFFTVLSLTCDRTFIAVGGPFPF